MEKVTRDGRTECYKLYVCLFYLRWKVKCIILFRALIRARVYYYVPLSCQDAGFLHQTAMNLMDIIPSFQTRLLQRSAVWVY